MAINHFDVLILLGRPASGKSEIIDFLKKTPPIERAERFHIGLMDEIDDFPMLWAWFEEDAILKKIMGKPHLHTDEEGYFLYQYQWDLLIERICLEYQKKLREKNYHAQHTTLIEFSRGSEHGGYRTAFEHLSELVLRNAAILYVNVTYEESLRKNRRRFNPEKPDSILEHGLPDAKLERLYKAVDWQEVSAADPEFIRIKGINVPYVVFENMPEKTNDFGKLAPALEEAFAKLWKIWVQKAD
jgi:hypothetical protein